MTAISGASQGPEIVERSPDASPSVQALRRTVFALLVLASLAAFLITQRLKHTPTPVQRFTLLPVFSPSALGHNKQELFSFRIASQDRVTVSIVDSSGVTVATVENDLLLHRYTQLPLSWSGRRGPHADGPLAASGEYRVRVNLLRQHREVFSPKSFRLILHPKHDHTA